MRIYTAIIERCPDTRLYVGHVPGLSGAHSQGETLEELNANLREVIELLLEDGEPVLNEVVPEGDEEPQRQPRSNSTITTIPRMPHPE